MSQAGLVTEAPNLLSTNGRAPIIVLATVIRRRGYQLSSPLTFGKHRSAAFLGGIRLLCERWKWMRTIAGLDEAGTVLLLFHRHEHDSHGGGRLHLYKLPYGDII